MASMAEKYKKHRTGQDCRIDGNVEASLRSRQKSGETWNPSFQAIHPRVDPVDPKSLALSIIPGDFQRW